MQEPFERQLIEGVYKAHRERMVKSSLFVQREKFWFLSRDVLGGLSWTNESGPVAAKTALPGGRSFHRISQ